MTGEARVWVGIIWWYSRFHQNAPFFVGASLVSTGYFSNLRLKLLGGARRENLALGANFWGWRAGEHWHFLYFLELSIHFELVFKSLLIKFSKQFF
jgi:hypothetical protein